MSWSTRTWQPTVRRDGPLVVIASFFLLPAFFFFTAWYASYIRGQTSTVVATIAAGIALLMPAFLCYRLAGRAGRRRMLWALLILAGSILSLWLPARYVILDGPLPTALYVAVPEALREVAAASLVTVIPLLAGAIPVVVYSLALGLDRPLAGVPPRGAVLMSASAGTLVWFAALFITLLNPAPPPFVPLPAQVEVRATLSPEPTLPGEVVPATWTALLWRLHDGIPPGATDVSLVGQSLLFSLPASVQPLGLLNVLMGRGTVELVAVGDSPPAAGTEVSTTVNPQAGVEETFETVATGGEFLKEPHWSGTGSALVELEVENSQPIMTVRFDEEGRETLRVLSEDDPGQFLALVLDNVVLLAFPAGGAIEDGALVIRRLEPEVAEPLAAILRYGPLPLVPAVEMTP